MAAASGIAEQQLQHFNNEVTTVREELNMVDAELFGETSPSVKPFQLLEEKQQRLVQEVERLNDERCELSRAFATGALAPPPVHGADEALPSSGAADTNN
jgi:hypothetical protein